MSEFETGYVMDIPTWDEVHDSLLRIDGVTERLGALSDGGGFIDEPLWYLNQRGQSCTGHFLARSAYWILGIKMSPYFPWTWGRIHDSGKENISDVGVSSRSIRTAARDHGLCAFDAWDPDRDRLHSIPNAIARGMAQNYLVDIKPIYDVGDALVNRLCDSLDLKQPGGIVVTADDAFNRPIDGMVGPPSSGSRGLHIVAAKHYRTRSDGRREIFIENSWSKNYGIDGGAWLHPDRVGRAPFACYVKGIEAVAA